MDLGPLGSAALELVGQGWYVHPSRPGRKKPATPHAWKDATTNPAVITEWWSGYPDLNVAVATGPSQLVVVDIDVKEGGPNGIVEWCQLVAHHVDTEPATFEVETPSGGLHLYFQAPTDSTIGNSAGKLAPGIDVRAQGGYVVAPPSVVGGNRYTVREDRPVAVAPSWLVELLAPPAPILPRDWKDKKGRSTYRTPPYASGRSYAEAALEAECQAVADAPVGTRNDALNRAAFSLGQLVVAVEPDMRLDEQVVRERLYATAVLVGLEPAEVKATIQSGLSKGAEHPRSAA